MRAKLSYPNLGEGFSDSKANVSNGQALYAKGAILFREGEEPAGIYVIAEGQAKLSVNSRKGKTLALGFFGAGSVLGLAATILGRTHITTAEITKPTKIVFVSRRNLVEKLQSDLGAACQAARLVSESCYFLVTKMAAVQLSDSSGQKLAKCLLGFAAGDASSAGRLPISLELSQEALAEMVGLSRETVSRLLAQFKKSGILDWKRAGLLIRDQRALERLAEMPMPDEGREAEVRRWGVGGRTGAATDDGECQNNLRRL